ncbi:MAG TPA: cell division protein FtsQ/DivIB [Candidatus Paceibacterota bacterium]
MQEMRAKPRAAAPIEKPTPVSKRNVTIARGKKARPEAKEPLKKRRKKAKKALAIVLLITVALLLALMTYLAWLPALRVSAVSADGPHAAEVEQIARQALYGTHAYVLPRNSLFFIPERDIRARVLEAFPDIEAVSIRPQGLTALSVSVVPRAEAYIWCGTARETPEESCYSANAAGLIFAPLSPETASTSEALRVYAPIEGQQDASPVRAHIARGENIPEALRFVKAMQELGADVTALAFRGDEGDVYTVAGTRITYVLGREQEAAGIAASVFPQLSLNDGSVAYVDLRFSGKAYFKRAAPAPEESE